MAEKKHSILRGVLIVLFLAFCLSSGTVGFLLGRNASHAAGEMVDTIVLSPGASSYTRENVLHYLTGRVLDDEVPLAGVTVLLVEEERSDVTNEQGKFYFSDLPTGTYTVRLLDETGETCGETLLGLEYSDQAAISAEVSEHAASFSLPDQSRLLELVLDLEEEGGVTVDQENSYFVTRDGQVGSFDGAAVQAPEEGRVVTPAGDTVDAQGYVMLVSEAVVITPTGQAVEAEIGEETAPGTVLAEDGSLLTEEGITLLPSSQVLLPTGELVGGNKVLVVTRDEVEELEELPDTYTPVVQQPQALPAEEPAAEPTAVQPQALSTEEPAAEPTARPQADPTPTPTPVPTPKEGVRLEDRDGRTWAWVGDTRVAEWSQRALVDLFRNRSQDLGEEDGMVVVAPGTKGYYLFRLENPESYDIAYTISLEEASFHLPIRYSVMNNSNNRSYLYRQRFAEGEVLTTSEVTIAAGKSMDLRIDWDWSYEDWFRKEKDDALDTAAARRADRTYLLALDLHAYEVVPDEQPVPDGGAARPGRR